MTKIIGLSLVAAFAVMACVKRGYNNNDNSSSEVEEFQSKQILGKGLSIGGKNASGAWNNTIALTFDDGPGPSTLELAKFLEEQDMPATFFMQGSNAAKYQSTIAQMAAMKSKKTGKPLFLIANHTYTHCKVTGDADMVVGEVDKTNDIVSKYSQGPGSLFFRSPYGMSINAEAIKKLNCDKDLKNYVGPIYWDVGGELTDNSAADWACWGKNVSVHRCGELYVQETNARHGGIILAHDIHAKTVQMMKNILPELKNKFTFLALNHDINAVNKYLSTQAHELNAAAAKASTETYEGAVGIKQISDNPEAPNSTDKRSGLLVSAFCNGCSSIDIIVNDNLKTKKNYITKAAGDNVDSTVVINLADKLSKDAQAGTYMVKAIAYDNAGKITAEASATLKYSSPEIGFGDTLKLCSLSVPVANVRSAPLIGNNIIGTIVNQTVAMVPTKNMENGWYNFEEIPLASGKTVSGFMHASIVACHSAEMENDVPSTKASTDISNPVLSPNNEAKANYCEVNNGTSGVNIRKAAKTSASVIAQVNGGESILFLEKIVMKGCHNSNGIHLKVSSTGVEGYSCAGFFKNCQ